MNDEKDIRPPRLGQKTLQWFCDPELLEDVEGDLYELFKVRASKNPRLARWMYFKDVLHLFRPGIVKDFRPFHFVNNTAMLLNHINVATRQARKHKGYTAINIAGLVVGLASCMLIMLWASDELLKDKFHKKSDRIYKVWRNLVQTEGEIITTQSIPYPLENVLLTEYPEVEAVTSVSWSDEYLFTAGDVSMFETGRFVTPGFHNVFTFPLIAGDETKALNDVNSIIISDRMAAKFFGSTWRESAIGKTIRIDEKEEVAVTGIFIKPGSESSLQFDWLMPTQRFLDHNEWMNDWTSGSFQIYFLLKPDADISAVRARAEGEINRHVLNSPPEPLYLQLFAANYLYGRFENGVPSGGRYQYVGILLVIGSFILLIACINFTNLATARAGLRAREIAVRKVMGAFRSTLRHQFYVEAVLYAIVATLIAVTIAYISLPYFNNLTGKSLTIDFTNPGVWLTIGGAAALTAVLSGVYPSIALSSLSVARSLRGQTKQSRGSYFRQILVTFQFGISIFLISGAIVVSQQLDYILNTDIGVTRENLISVDLLGDLYKKKDVYLNSLRTIPEVKDVTFTNGNPTQFGRSTGGAQWPGKDPNNAIEINVLAVGENFTSTMGIKVVRGEDFSNVYTRDSARFLINEVLARIMGSGDPVGKELSLWGTTGTIAGVVKNFHMDSMYEPIAPLIIRYSPRQTGIAYIRISGDVAKAVSAIEGATKEIDHVFPFRYQFVDEQFANTYRSEASVSSLVNIFASVSIFIACLGLLGLSSFAADQRAKEIGVRKVHGASTTSVMLLLSKHYAKLMVVAFAIAAPLSYVYMRQWLDGFVFHIDAEIHLFVFAGIVSFMIGAITVGYKSYSAAVANPAKTLKEE